MVEGQIAFPWAGERAERHAPACTLSDLTAAYADVQRRFEARMAAERERDRFMDCYQFGTVENGKER